jgi:hypothetical protein
MNLGPFTQPATKVPRRSVQQSQWHCCLTGETVPRALAAFYFLRGTKPVSLHIGWGTSSTLFGFGSLALVSKRSAR